MKKVLVTKKFVEDAKEMAYDLYGLAEINGDKEIMKEMRKFLKKADKYLEEFDKTRVLKGDGKTV